MRTGMNFVAMVRYLQILRRLSKRILVSDPEPTDIVAIYKHHSLAHGAHVHDDRIPARRRIEIPLETKV